MRVGRTFDLEGGLEVEQVEDRAPGAALAGGDVADVAAGDVDCHDSGGAVVGVLGALDRGVEVVDELLGFGLLAEDLAEVGDLTDKLLVEGLSVARLKVDERDVGGELLDLGVELGEALAGDDQVGLGGDQGLKVGLAVHAHVGDALAVKRGDGGGDELLGGGDQLDVPLLQHLEGAVVQGGRAGDGQVDLDHAVVCVDCHRRGLGGARGVARGSGGLRGGGGARGTGSQAEGSDGGDGGQGGGRARHYFSVIVTCGGTEIGKARLT